MTAPPPGYPKLSRRVIGDHAYEVLIQARPRAGKVPIGTVKRFGSLPSMRSWRACGYWDGAKVSHGRARRSDAEAWLWSQWREHERQRIIAAAAEVTAEAERLGE